MRLIEEQGSVEQFMAVHNCRLPGEQPELAAAYAHAGTTWRGSGAIAGLEVDADALGCIGCPTLVLRGEHDFVTEACVAPWSALPEATFMTLAGTSHHALLEDTGAYLLALGGFLCDSDASGGGGDASGVDLEIDLQRIRLQMREEEDSLTGDFDLDDSDTWAAETELLRVRQGRAAKSEAGAIKEARKEKYPLTGTALYGGVLFAAAVLGAQYAVKEGLVPAELSLVALALTGPVLAASGSLANWRGEDIEESAPGQKRTYTENLQTFFRLKRDGENEGNEGLPTTERLPNCQTTFWASLAAEASAMRRFSASWLFSAEAGRLSSSERRSSSTSPDRGRALRSSASHRRRLPGWGSPELGRPPQPQEQHKLRRTPDSADSPELGRPQQPQEQHTGQLQQWDGRSIERRLSEQGVLTVLVRSARGLHAPEVDKGRVDQYVRVSLGPSRSKSSRSKRTGVVEKTINPRYNCELQFAGALLDLTKEGLQLQLLDQDAFARGNDAVPSGVVLIEAAAFQQLLTSQAPAAEPAWAECSKRLDTQGYLSFSLRWEADSVKFVDVVEAAVALGVANAKQFSHGGAPERWGLLSEEEWKARIEAEDAVAFGTHAPGSDAAAAASHLRGVTIGWLLEFTELHQCWEWTTQEVADRIIKPATARTRCRFADLKIADHAAADLKAVRTNTPRAPATVGPATVYVSHCWGGSWGALCRALSDEHGQAVRVWIDVAAVRLWQGNSADQGLHGRIIRRCTSFVVVCSAVEVLRFNGVDCIGGLTSTQMVARRVDQLEPEVRTSLAFLRSWVLAELLTALDTPGLRGGVTVKIGRLAKRPQGGYAYVQEEGMTRALATLVDVEHAQASLPADQEMLRREVFRARAGGAKATNYLLQRLLSATASGQDRAIDGRGELTKRGYAEEAREGATPTEQLTVWAVSAVGGGSFGEDSEALMRLISRGAQPAAFACDGISPLMAAVELQNVDALELILFHLGSQASAAVNLMSPLDGQTALITASSLGNEGIVLILLQNRADPVLPNSQETFPLQVAAQLGKPSVVALLLKCRAKVDQRANPRKLTALHAAASANNTEAIQLLLKARAKVDERVQPRKITALHVAAGEGHTETVQLLLNAWKQNPGKAVQQLTRSSSHDPYYFIVNDRTKDGATALSLARSAHHVHTVQFLLAANADPNTEVVTTAQSLEQHIGSARGMMSARSNFTDEDGMSARSGLSTARNLSSARGTARSEFNEEGGLSVRGGLSSRRDVGSARRISSRSQRTEEAQSGLPTSVRSSSRRANAIAISSMSLLAEQLDGYLASKDYELAAALLDPSVEWQTPAWKASGHAAVRAKWASGVDDKWGVTPVWREVIGGGRGLVFTRECEAFRVMGWPVRLRQTFHVRQKGVGYVVLKTVIERL